MVELAEAIAAARERGDGARQVELTGIRLELASPDVEPTMDRRAAVSGFQSHDTHASVKRCAGCGLIHSWPWTVTCARCGQALPLTQGCEADVVGAGACPRHPNGCPVAT